MKKYWFILPATASIVIATNFSFPFAYDQPAEPRNGQVYESHGAVQAWDENAGEWVTPEAFWLSYAERNNGKFWGRTATYPPYDDVSEFDTILIELEHGVCLMEFFHTRWRRAQDVRRWDTAFNDYGGCPNVFE